MINISIEPILIEKSKNPATVMLSYKEHQKLINIENKMLLSEAINAASEGFLDNKESDQWTKEMNQKFTS